MSDDDITPAEKRAFLDSLTGEQIAQFLRAMGKETFFRIATGEPERLFWRRDKDGNVIAVVSLADLDDMPEAEGGDR
jgi:hypothetical protein